MNKKIKNATPKSKYGINFKSKTEERFYTLLLEAGFKPRYEETMYTLWKGRQTTVPFYTQVKSKKDSQYNLINKGKRTLRDITYTPDFTITAPDGTTIFIEAKGFVNDVYPIKRKLFRSYLEDLANAGYKVAFFEIYSMKQLVQAINIIKEIYGPAKNQGAI